MASPIIQHQCPGTLDPERPIGETHYADDGTIKTRCPLCGEIVGEWTASVVKTRDANDVCCQPRWARGVVVYDVEKFRRAYPDPRTAPSVGLIVGGAA